MDNDLDDFFAKKDKSKKKTKSYSAQKFTVDDILQAKKENEEKTKKGKQSKKKIKDPSQPEGAIGLKTEGDDEEWVEVEEETEKDYTGLRIQNLQIIGKCDEDRQDSGTQREDGDDGDTRESAQGPWKMMASSVTAVTPCPVQSVPETPVIEPVKEATPRSVSGKYVPPQMRRTQGDVPAVTVSGGATRHGRGGKKNAPNVNSQEDFPTLGSIAEPTEGAAFEKIRGGARQVDDPAGQHTKVSVGNKFDALNNDDS